MVGRKQKKKKRERARQKQKLQVSLCPSLLAREEGKERAHQASISSVKREIASGIGLSCRISHGTSHHGRPPAYVGLELCSRATVPKRRRQWKKVRLKMLRNEVLLRREVCFYSWLAKHHASVFLWRPSSSFKVCGSYDVGGREGGVSPLALQPPSLPAATPARRPPVSNTLEPGITRACATPIYMCALSALSVSRTGVVILETRHSSETPAAWVVIMQPTNSVMKLDGVMSSSRWFLTRPEYSGLSRQIL